MGTTWKLTEGMVVYSSDGERLGKVISCQASGFTVEKGLFLPKASRFRYDDVSDVRDGAVRLLHERAKLMDEWYWAQSSLGAMQATVQAAEQPPSPALEQEEIAVQLAEEELVADKYLRDLGEVRVTKRVVVTEKQITVPVMHEEVVIERVPLDPDAQLAPDAFKDSTFSIVLHAEELEIHKRPVAREVVRIKRRALQEERTASAEIRREEVDIEQPQFASQRIGADSSVIH